VRKETVNGNAWYLKREVPHKGLEVCRGQKQKQRRWQSRRRQKQLKCLSVTCFGW